MTRLIVVADMCTFAGAGRSSAFALVLTAITAGIAMASSSSSSSSYNAGVVEYVFGSQPLPMPTTRAAAVAYMNTNLDSFESYLTSAVSGVNGPSAQIVVFPEYGVLGWPTDGNWDRDNIVPFMETIPNPTANAMTTIDEGETDAEEGVSGSTPPKQNAAPSADVNPCTDGDPTGAIPITTRLSCLARQFGITLVADYGDIVYCNAGTDPGCPADGRLQYNTAVAFGSDGTLLAKYHKCHLFGGEAWYLNPANATTPGQPCPTASFRTDFGVTFGLLICYDIMFTPATESSYAFPTFWVNNLHPPNATQEQRAWTAQYDTTLLAANIGNSAVNSSGSGIWVNGVALAEYVNTGEAPEQQLLLATVPFPQ